MFELTILVWLLDYFQREVPWVFGFPLSFFGISCALSAFASCRALLTLFFCSENKQSKVASNFKLMESISIAALQTQADTIDDMLKHVTEKLFGMTAVLSGKVMRINLRLIEQSIDYEVAPGNKAPAPGSASGSTSGSTPAPASTPAIDTAKDASKKEEKK
jgi:hypothetical protein